jgi:3-deoxy-D-manno-octulosonate 8-phosphate phosphatase (KDO 8-P phosphatase)
MQIDIPSLEAQTPAAERSLAERLAAAHTLVVEIEGVITDGRSLLAPDGGESLFIFRPDIWALEGWLAAGRGLVIVSRPGLSAAEALAQRLGALYRPAGGDKGLVLKQTAFDLTCKVDQVCYLGRDLDDLPALTIAGLAVCPPQAPTWVREACHIITEAPAGLGAVREVVDRLLADWVPAEI